MYTGLPVPPQELVKGYAALVIVAVWGAAGVQREGISGQGEGMHRWDCGQAAMVWKV